ncbi:restriction endonuclease subunit S [Pseudomonas sp. Irchel s3f10]|uniref:restriction endonuclease subunit S n=1 Tax=Pseudomonas sp. Irchel s3f10 TaxID=2009137 RepID=UPI000BA452A6|nr:restriction endonuclease subunit S [Pseudomonas sp. Irchel s3f10]
MSFSAYPDYKDSGIDWLGHFPEGWSIKPLWALFRRHKLTGFPDEQLLSVYRDYGVIPKASRDDNFNKPSDDLGAYQLVQVGDLAINKMKAWQGSVGISSYKGIVSPAYHVYAPSHSEAPQYLHYLFRCNEYIAGYLANSKGIRVNQWDLEPQQHSRMSVLLPSCQEQTQIARFLDHETACIDALIEEQQRLIELLKEKRQAVISHVVTKGLNPMVPMKDSGVEWLGEVPAHWNVSRLKYHSTRIGDGLHSTPEYDDAGDYFFINGNNLVGGAITISPTTRQVNRQEFLKHRVLLDSSTVLISINGTIGNLALYSGEPVILGKSAAYINCTESLSPRFCLYLFSSEQIKRFFENQLTGTTIYNLSLRTIAEIPTPLPSIDEQNSIVEFLNRNVDGFDELIDNAMKLAQLLQERRSALISAAVTGKIDVRGWQPPASVPTPELVQEAV